MESLNTKFRDYTRDLALQVIKELSPLPYTDAVGVVRKQIIRSVTSVAANYRASCRARSQRERYAKMCIVVEEADETLFWLEMIESMELIDPNTLSSLKSQAEEIVKVMSSYRKSLKPKSRYK